MTHEVEGACHCGAVRVTMRLSRPASELPLNACQCGFCRAHGAGTVADPAGEMVVRAARESDVARYRFAESTADFLLCAHCGVYVAALLGQGGEGRAIANAAGLSMAEFAGREPRAVVYDGESAPERIARREANWTPARLLFETPAAA